MPTREVVTYTTPSALYEKSKSSGSGGGTADTERGPNAGRRRGSGLFGKAVGALRQRGLEVGFRVGGFFGLAGLGAPRQ